MAFVPWSPHLVKSNKRNYSRVPLYINSGNGLWRFPYGTVKKQYPGLLSLFQQNGNRFLNPTSNAIFNPAIQTFQQLNGQKDAWDILMSIVGRNGSWSFRNGVNGQPDYFDQLFDLLRAAYTEIFTGVSPNGVPGKLNLLQALILVDDLSWVIGMNGAGVSGSFAFGSGMYLDLFDLGQNFASILGDVDSDATMDLMEAMARIFGNDQRVLDQLINSLGMSARVGLKSAAQQRWWLHGSIVGQLIYSMIP